MVKPLMLLEEASREEGCLPTLVMIMVKHMRRDPARTYYIVFPILRVCSENLIGFYNRVLGGFPQPPPYHLPHLVLRKFSLKFGEDPYAAACLAPTARTPKRWAQRGARRRRAAMEADLLPNRREEPPLQVCRQQPGHRHPRHLLLPRRRGDPPREATEDHRWMLTAVMNGLLPKAPPRRQWRRMNVAATPLG